MIGFGRSGSTHLHALLSFHPQMAWLSKFADRYPERMWINRLVLRAFDIGPFADLIARKLPPREGWRYWEHFFPGFSEPFRDLRAEDVTPYVAGKMREAVKRMRTESRPHPLIKLTGWPRIGFLRKIFPEARFVHILRDGRAAANSLMHVSFWRGWKGPEQWRWGPLPERYRHEWDRWDRSFVALAAIQWKIVLDAFDEARPDSEQLLEIKYEDACARPQETFRSITDFCGVPWSEKLEARLKRARFRQANYRWREELDARQQEMLEDLLGERCRELGY
jgi:hypothetical protein